MTKVLLVMWVLGANNGAIDLELQMFEGENAAIQCEQVLQETEYRTEGDVTGACMPL